MAKSGKIALKGRHPKQAERLLLGYAREADIKALFELLGMVAKAGSRGVTTEEISEVSKFITVQVPASHAEYARQCFRSGRDSPALKGEITARAFQLYGFQETGDTDRWLEPLQVLDILLRVALADGQYTTDEATILEGTRHTLGVHIRSYWVLRDTLADRVGVSIPGRVISFNNAGGVSDCGSQQARSDGQARDQKSATTEAALRKQALTCLGLTDGASKEEIRTRFRTLVKQCHPDVVRDTATEAECRAATMRFCQIREAYDLLAG